MKWLGSGNATLFAVIVMIVSAVLGERLYLSRFAVRYTELEKKRVAAANQLATAKIVQENLNHVRELVFENMDLRGSTDSIPPESKLFSFITECVNDLKLVLISIKPTKPAAKGRITTMGYELEFEADFFTLGELFAKFENSRRLVAVESFEITSLKGAGGGLTQGEKSLKVRLLLNTFRVKKG